MMKTLLIGVGVLAAVLPASAQNLLSNPGFESPEITGNFNTYGNGANLGGWTVGGHSIDLIHSYWNSSEGHQDIDIDGSGVGSVAQTVSIDPSKKYRLTFDMSGNPDGGPIVKSISVYWGGILAGHAIYDRSLTHNTRSDMMWEGRSMDLPTLSGSSAELSLRSDTVSDSPYFGAAIDNVSVRAVPEPASMTVLAIGAAAMIRRRRKA